MVIVLDADQQEARPLLTENEIQDLSDDEEVTVQYRTKARNLRKGHGRSGFSVLIRFLAYSTVGFLFILAFGLVFLPRTSLRRDYFRLHNTWLSEAELDRLLFESIDASQIRGWSKNYTRKSHLAGDGVDLAEWTRDKFTEYGWDSKIETYYTYLNRPVSNALTLLDPTDGDVKFRAKLEEDVLEEDPTTDHHNDVPVFHGYSARGNVTAKFVYANYGRKEDFDSLVEKGVDIKGKIVLVRYNAIYRGLKVRHAEQHGAVGVVIFSDPTDDGGVDFAHDIKPYPKGPARNPSSVQRGSVLFLSEGPGDPTTPGWASTIDAERKDPGELIPSIPSIPISYADATHILKALNGYGPGPKDFKDSNWGGILEGVKYNVGPSKLELNLFNDQDYEITPINNVIGKIEGIIPNEIIIVGNHRDSWIKGGAADPNSGSAVLLSIAKALGRLKAEHGWKPLRTIVLGSWDGEEYALLGSTEWGEDHAKYLTKHALAYINLDVAVSGHNFKGSASPQLNSLLREVTKRVTYPSRSDEKSQSVYDHWKETSGARISTLGSGSDYSVFLDHLGIPSLDFGFTGGHGDPAYHYHSNYDSFHWMDTFVDPDWELHATAARVLGLLTATLSEHIVVDFKLNEYATVLSRGLHDILTKYPLESVSAIDASDHDDHRRYDDDGHRKETPKELIRRLQIKLSEFEQVGRRVDAYTAKLTDQYRTDYPWYKFPKKLALLFRIHRVNLVLSKLERLFLFDQTTGHGCKEEDTRKLTNRDKWFRHVFFAPDRYLGYGGAIFPGILEAFQDGDRKKLIKWLRISADVVGAAVDKLNKVY
jgi:N-acetylated-alpha-linked acidic dipeptidase